MAINRVILVGNLARDPEVKYTPAGLQIASSSIAVNRITKNESGDYEVDFFNITAFSRTADYMSKYVTKGSKIAIEGRLQTRSWVDQASGQKRTSFEIIVDNIQSLSSRQDDAGSRTGDDAPREEYAPSQPSAPAARASAPSSPSPTRTSRSAPPPPAADESDDADPFADE